MALTVNYVSQLTVVETLGGVFLGTDNTVTTNGLNTTAELTASTTPPVTKVSAGRLTLSGGTGSIDLTSLPDSNGTAAAVTLSGLKLQAVKLRNKATNANTIKVAVGASNGHTAFGADFAVTLYPGDELTWKGNDQTPDVASNNKTFDVTGTGSQVLEFAFVAG